MLYFEKEMPQRTRAFAQQQSHAII